MLYATRHDPPTYCWPIRRRRTCRPRGRHLARGVAGRRAAPGARVAYHRQAVISCAPDSPRPAGPLARRPLGRDTGRAYPGRLRPLGVRLPGRGQMLADAAQRRPPAPARRPCALAPLWALRGRHFPPLRCARAGGAAPLLRVPLPMAAGPPR